MLQLIPTTITITIKIPALDRLMDYLEASQQAEIDAATQKLNLATQQERLANTQLEVNIQKEKP